MAKPTVNPVVSPLEGEPGRFRVLSRTRMQKDHLVDLAANGGFGECTCERYHYVIHKKIQAGEKTNPCWHVGVAQSYIKERLFEEFQKWLQTHSKKKANG